MSTALLVEPVRAWRSSRRRCPPRSCRACHCRRCAGPRVRGYRPVCLPAGTCSQCLPSTLGRRPGPRCSAPQTPQAHRTAYQGHLSRDHEGLPGRVDGQGQGRSRSTERARCAVHRRRRVFLDSVKTYCLKEMFGRIRARIRARPLLRPRAACRCRVRRLLGRCRRASAARAVFLRPPPR